MKIDFDRAMEWYRHRSAFLVWVWMAAAVVFTVIAVNVGGIVIPSIMGVLWVVMCGTGIAWASTTNP